MPQKTHRQSNLFWRRVCRIHAEPVHFRLRETLERIVGSFDPTARRYGVSVELAIHVDDSCSIHMRKSGFQMLMYNLLLNAAQQIEMLRPLHNSGGEILVELDRQLYSRA